MRYQLRGEISVGSHDKLFDALLEDPDDVIQIDISCLGGEVSTLLQYLTNIIRVKKLGKKLVTYAEGEASSAAATILWQGDEIYVSPVAQVMFHQSVDDDSLILGFWQRLRVKLAKRYIKKVTKGKPTAAEFADMVLNPYEPWNAILKEFGEDRPVGDYFMSATEFKLLAPERITVGFPQYELELFDADGETDDC